jgi:RNAse (barnase) inhibitor barstar
MRTIELLVDDLLPVALQTVNWCIRSLLTNPDVSFLVHTEFARQLMPVIPIGSESRVILSSDPHYAVRPAAKIRVSADEVAHRDCNGNMPFLYNRYFRQLSRSLGVVSGYRFDHDCLIDLPPRQVQRPTQVLFINNPTRGEQWPWDQQAILSVLKSVQDRGRTVIATAKNQVCPWTDNYSPADIGWLATQVDYVIGVNADPMMFCFNTRAISRVREYFVLDQLCHFPYSGRCHRARTLKEFVTQLKAAALC